MIETTHYVVDTPSQKIGGIYYTPPLAAEAMVSWALRSESDRVLEPCFGSGVFLDTIKQIAESKGFHSVQTYGVELMGEAYNMAISTNLLDIEHSILGDFLGVDPFPVDVVIGNPPYVRLRSLPSEQEKRALEVTSKMLGAPMDTSGSVWMAFMIHAVRFLVRGGRLAFVLPYEFTHVRYSRPLWEFLAKNFGQLKVVRSKERLFPELMQEALILFAENYGGSTTDVEFEAFDTTSDFIGERPTIKKQFSVREVINSRPFIKALLSDDLAELLDNRLFALTAIVPQSCTFNIGYVSGHKGFFHPGKQTIASFGLPDASLRDSITASRELRGIGLKTSYIPPENTKKLFYPNGNLSECEKRYILKGEEDKVHCGYKCRKRKPWYKVPDVRIPDLFMSVFQEKPTLVHNDRGLVASNSLLCGFLSPTCTAKQFIAAWYTSLTLLYYELQVHSLGGGVLVSIPGEVAKIRIPHFSSMPVSHLDKIDSALKATARTPYQIGDNPVLKQTLGLDDDEIELIRTGTEALAKWRTAWRT